LNGRPLFSAAFAGLLVAACSGPADPPPPDGGEAPACDPACNAQTQVCNLTTLQCEYNADALPQQALLAARAAPHGPADLLVEGPLVTYSLTGEPAGSGVNGFFLQWRKEGPALFVAVDPDSLSPPPLPGDKVSLRITQLHKQEGTVEARAISGYQRLSSGNALDHLVQDVSQRGDLVAAGGDYDGELVRVSGRLRHDWLPMANATGHFRSELELPILFADPDLVLRANVETSRPLGLGTGCVVALERIPLRRSGTQMQIFGFHPSSFTQRTCPPTRLQAAIAVSPTHVRLTFERPLGTWSVNPDGSDFDFGDGLVGKYAAVLPTGNQVLVTTAVQTPRAAHTVTIASTAKDMLGGPLVAPAAKAGFQGYFPRAKLLLNELNCARPNDRDLIELVALTSGSTMGLQLTYDGPPTSGVIGTFPDTEVEAGDLIVVHLNADPGYGDAVYNETVSKDEQPATSNHAFAWDFVYDKFSCAHSNVVLRLKGPDGTTLDGVALVNSGLSSAQRPAEFGSVWLKALQLDGHWLPKACGGLTCSYHSEPSAIDVSADWRDARTAGGVTSSLSRRSLTDTDTLDDWVITTPPSFGHLNPGQAPE
jgi:hypothetical protein